MRGIETLETFIRQHNNKLAVELVKQEIAPAPTEAERFDDWMRNTVKSVHYSSNERMLNAYKRLQ